MLAGTPSPSDSVPNTSIEIANTLDRVRQSIGISSSDSGQALGAVLTRRIQFRLEEHDFQSSLQPPILQVETTSTPISESSEVFFPPESPIVSSGSSPPPKPSLVDVSLSELLQTYSQAPPPPIVWTPPHCLANDLPSSSNVPDI